MIQWPTLVTILLWPVMLAVYSRLAKKEETAMIGQFGLEYLEYKKSVPAFFPLPKRERKRERMIGQPSQTLRDQA